MRRWTSCNGSATSKNSRGRSRNAKKRLSSTDADRNRRPGGFISSHRGELDEGTTMKSVKLAIATTALVAAATVIAPPAQAMMLPGNYDVLTNRYTRASWVWTVYPCQPPARDCANISATPRLKFYNFYNGFAHLADGRWTLTVDVSDGLQCLPGYAMPTHETWSWDENSLAGTIESNYDVGCFNGPPGSQFWTFALQRL